MKSKASDLYSRLEKCEEAPLVLFTLSEFYSLREMDELIAEGRLMSFLAQRLVSVPCKRILGIFENEILLLHFQAENNGISLKPFYEAAL